MTDTKALAKIYADITWQQAISFLRNLAGTENFASMSGPEALTQAAHAMQMALDIPDQIAP